MGNIHLLYQEVERLRKAAEAEHRERMRKMERGYRITIRWVIGVGAVSLCMTIAAILMAIFGG